MSRFCSGVQRRRRSPRVMISTRVLCGLLRLVVRALSSSAAKSEALSIAALHHSESACRNVAAPHRLQINIPNSRFYVPFYFDAGGGDLKLTWQGYAGIGYQTSFADLSL